MTLISLAINTKNPVTEWLNQAITTGLSFDEIVIYVDSGEINDHKLSKHIHIISDGKSRSIKDGFNLAIENTDGEWICSFCDDDYFTEHLPDLLNRIKEGEFDDYDVIHFPVRLMGGALWGQAENITYEKLKDQNLIPHGAFFKRCVFQKLAGYKIDACADWNFWLRAAKAGFKFKYFDKPVYFFRQSTNRSAYSRQLKEYGYEGMKDLVMSNA